MKRFCLSLLFAITLLVVVFQIASIPTVSIISSLKHFSKSEQEHNTSNAVPPSFTGIKKISDLPYEQKYTYPKIQFITEQHGWIAIGRKLWKTENAGQTWECIFDEEVIRFAKVIDDLITLDGFQFLNSQVGWVLVHDHLFRTDDGGSSWFPLTLPEAFKVSRFNGLITAFHFFNGGKRGWLGGGIYRRLKKDEGVTNRFSSADGRSGIFAAIFYTEDGGISWKEQQVERTTGWISDFYFFNAEHGWAVGQMGALFLDKGDWKISASQKRDDDGNPSVKSLYILIGAPTYCPIAVYFVNPRNGWLSNSNGYLARSTDGGKTWIDILNPRTVWDEQPLPPSFQNLYFINQTEGWGLDTNGRIHKTKDGGVNWSKIEADIEFTDWDIVDSQTAWAVSTIGVFRVFLRKE